MEKPRVKARQLIKMIPESALNEFCTLVQVDKGVSKLSGKLIFNLLIYGLLHHKELSTRILEKIYNSQLFEYFCPKDNHKTRHSSLSDRIKAIKPEYFEAIFNFLQEKIFQAAKKLNLKDSFLRVDSTMIRIGAGLVDWGMKVGPQPQNGKGYKHLKLTVTLSDLTAVRADIYHEQEYLSEYKAMKDSLLAADNKSILLFDRGMSKRSVFEQLCDQNSRFITRANPNIAYQLISVHSEVPGEKKGNLTFISDELVKLYDSGHKHITAHSYRLIKAENDKGEKVYFITNLIDIPADDIAEMYRKRWDIEVFFKFLKQELNLKHLVSHDLNGVRVMMYATLITAALLMLYKQYNQLDGYKLAKLQLIQELQMEIIEELSNLKAQEILRQYGIYHNFEI